MSSEIDIARRSLDLFGIGGDLRLVSSGLDSVYRVAASDGRVFALRVSSGMPIRGRSAFHTETSWIHSLITNPEFRVPCPQRTKADAFVGEVANDHDQERASMMLEWIPGRRTRTRTTKTHARTLGRIAASLHRQVRQRGLTDSGAIKDWDVSRMCGHFLTASYPFTDVFPGGAELVTEVETRLERAVARIGADGYGLINADLGLHNVLWHETGPGLVDFNDSGIGPFAFCLARLRSRLKGEYLVEELMKGYQDISVLPEGITELDGIFDLAADLFLVRYVAARSANQGTRVPENIRQLFRGFAARLGNIPSGRSE